MVEASYLDLFVLRNRYAKDVPIIGHAYDFPIPNGAHPACAGPWLLPSLQYCNWSVLEGTAIVKEALLAFNAMVIRLPPIPRTTLWSRRRRAFFSRATGRTLHPYPAGFKTMANAFLKVIAAKFPNRVDKR